MYAIELPPWTPWPMCTASHGDALKVSCHALRFPKVGSVTTRFRTPSVALAALLPFPTLSVEAL